MAEAILNFKGRPNFTAYSAGSHPCGSVRPETLRRLESALVPAYIERRQQAVGGVPAICFAEAGFVITVCDNAAKEVCPVWPGQPISAHWDRCISLFLALPLSSLDRLALKKEMDDMDEIRKDATADVSNRPSPNS